MLNSLLLFGGSFNKNKKLSGVFSLLLIINLLIVQVGNVSLDFIIFNVIIMFVITYILRNISNRRINSIMSVVSILIWSILIDLVSYYVFPFSNDTNILHYIFNGILFNFKYVLVNACILVCVEILSYIKNKVYNINTNVKDVSKIINF